MQKARINPSKIVPKEICIPGSKSFTNRALLISSLAEGKSILINPLFSEDTLLMINALKELGIKIETDENKNLIVNGVGGNFTDPNKNLFIGNAGTAMRFLTAMLTLCPFKSVITGDIRMQERPIRILVKALRDLGAKIETVKKNGFPPVKIKGNILPGGEINMSGKISSQYISALLMVAPYAQKDITINIEDELVSKPYIDMTIQIMKDFGVSVENISYKTFKVACGQGYKNTEYLIEGDTSSASYFYALSALHNVEIAIKNINSETTQADIRFLNVLEKMKDEKNPGILKPLGEINLNDMPDSAMTVAVMCCFAKGKSKLTNISNLKLKETNRIHALVTELTKIGVNCKELEDGIEINGDPEKLHGDALIETYNDHRIAMCMSLFATKLPNIQILNPDCTNKTYPRFFEDLQSLGIEIKKKKIPNIYLTGMRGSGKSSVGKIIANKINHKFIDTDEEIEKQEKTSIPEIVKKKNWFYFRKKEKYVVRSLARQNKTVIGTGGGVILDKENVNVLKKNGKIVFLNCSLETLEKRLKNEMNKRPSLTSHKELKDELKELWEKRKEKYFSSADLVIDSIDDLGLNEIAQQIILKI
jgi:3-phosphoshikimate 1-carboxyvinyltransferase